MAEPEQIRQARIMSERVMISMKLPRWLLTSLDSYARQRGKTRTRVVEELVEAALDDSGSSGSEQTSLL